jgi:hypothetical protein
MKLKGLLPADIFDEIISPTKMNMQNIINKKITNLNILIILKLRNKTIFE